MAKFKVGDIVKPNDKSKGEYAVTRKGNMLEGEVTYIDEKDKTMSVRMKKMAKGFLFHEGLEFMNLKMDYFDLVAPKRELHVTTDGTTTHAVLKEGGKVVKRAKAVCSPDDEYSFETGARLAIDRVFGKDEKSAEKKEPEYKFNIGDYVVVKDKNEAFPYFKDFVKRYDKDTQLLFAYGHCPKKGDHYTVITRGLHPETKAPLYLIQPSSNTLAFGELYLIGECGLALLDDCCKYL